MLFHVYDKRIQKILTWICICTNFVNVFFMCIYEKQAEVRAGSNNQNPGTIQSQKPKTNTRKHSEMQTHSTTRLRHQWMWKPGIYRQTNRMRHRWMQSVNEIPVNVISDESWQWVLGNIVVNETSGVECPLVTLKGTPPGDRYT